MKSTVILVCFCSIHYVDAVKILQRVYDHSIHCIFYFFIMIENIFKHFKFIFLILKTS